MTNHAEVVLEFEKLINEYKMLGFELVSDYVTGSGRFFFVRNLKPEESPSTVLRCNTDVFCCSAVEELRAWLNGYKRCREIMKESI